MKISRSAAGLAAAACLVMLAAGCGATSGGPGTGTSRTPAATATAAPSAPASTPATATAPVTTAPGSQLRAAPAGPFPAGTGTIANPFIGMCMTLAGDGTAVVARKCSPGATSQQWTGYNDGTLRINGKCLDVAGPQAGAAVKVAACTGTATQAWAIGQTSGNDFGPVTNMATGNVLTDPAASTVDGTRLVMKNGNGDLSAPWRVSYHHYVDG